MEIFLKKNKQKGTLISDTRVRLNFKFHSNLNISVQKLKNIPTYYKFFLKKLAFTLNFFSYSTSRDCITSSMVKQNIKIDNTFIYLSEISGKAYVHNEGLFLPSSYAVLEYEFE